MFAIISTKVFANRVKMFANCVKVFAIPAKVLAALADFTPYKFGP
jgi:hypothetical protein